ncbi:hypothetical protein [Bradyrhizobium sp. S3.2.12]|uniref:hypothetical protein n=1 Tax=Bradyrhizobium sp. S3.2.12 TaxID=3156387 RepID=UPI0033913D29
MVMGSAKASPDAEIHAANAQSKILKSMMASSYSTAQHAQKTPGRNYRRDAGYILFRQQLGDVSRNQETVVASKTRDQASNALKELTKAVLPTLGSSTPLTGQDQQCNRP